MSYCWRSPVNNDTLGWLWTPNRSGGRSLSLCRGRCLEETINWWIDHECPFILMLGKENVCSWVPNVDKTRRIQHWEYPMPSRHVYARPLHVHYILYIFTLRCGCRDSSWFVSLCNVVYCYIIKTVAIGACNCTHLVIWTQCPVTCPNWSLIRSHGYSCAISCRELILIYVVLI